jgi:uncharacterized protein
MRCRVSYALPQRQWEWQLELPAGSRIADALCLAQRQVLAVPGAPVVDWQGAKVGIFGRVCNRETALADGDRVEVYRPLAADPKISRRERAKRPKKS